MAFRRTSPFPALALAAFTLCAMPAMAGIWTSAQPTKLTPIEARDLERDVAGATGMGKASRISGFHSVRKGVLVGVCAVAETPQGQLPFYALYFHNRKPPFWKVSLAKSADKTFGILTVCNTMGITLPQFQRLANPQNMGGESGNGGDVRLSAEQRQLLENAVSAESGAGAPARLRGVIARKKLYKGKDITIACGFSAEGERNVPFHAVWIRKSDKGPARFAVSSMGGTPVRNNATFSICKADGIPLSGAP